MQRFQLCCMFLAMKKEDILAALTRNVDRLRELGIAHAAVFGSVARGEQTSESDVDILVELRPATRTVFDLVDIEQQVAELLPTPVHVAIADQLKPALRKRVLSDAVFAF